MVRAFLPQSFSRSLATNTNTPPQDCNAAGGGFVGDAGFEVINEPSPLNVGVLQWNDADIADSGSVEFDSNV